MTYRGPNTLWHEHRRDERLPALDRPYMRVLNGYREELQSETGRPIPHFDPFDAGVAARLLILLETPGPSAVPADRRFVSIDNPTGTALNLRTALKGSGISRKEIIVWNAVPWLRQTRRAIGKGERLDGVAALVRLLPLLPALQVAILAGAVAGHAEAVLKGAGIETVPAPHPSPILINTSKAHRQRLEDAFANARANLDQSNSSNDMS